MKRRKNFLVLCLPAVMGLIVGSAAAQQSPQDAPPPVSPPGALAVEIIRQSNPQTGKDILTAVNNLLNLNAPDVAREILGRWQSLQMDDRDRKALFDEFGSAYLLRLSTDERIAPLGGQIATELLQANQRVVRDPAEIARRIEALQSADFAVRQAARRALREAGDAAALPLLQAVATSDAQLRREYLQALVGLGVDAHRPLVTALVSPDPAVRHAALDALTFMGDRDVLPHAAALLHVDPSAEVRAAAARLLRRRTAAEPARAEAAEHVRQRIEQLLDAPAQEATFVSENLGAGQSAEASRLGQLLLQLAPEDQQARYWYVITQVMAVQPPSGAGTSEAFFRLEPSAPELFTLLSQWPTQELHAMLDRLLDEQRWKPATGVIEVLGKTGSVALLSDDQGQPQPLARALVASDRNVSFAAAEAIMQIDPAGPYPGAAHWLELAEFLTRSEGTPRALIIHARLEDVGTVAGWLQSLGYATDHASNARQAELMAAAHPDYELILLSDSVGDRSWYEVYQRVRRQPRTQSIPLALVVLDEPALDAEAVAIADPLTIAYPFPYELASVQNIVRLTRPMAAAALPPAQQRLQQAARAIGWLERIGGDRQRYRHYDVLPWQDELVRALYVPPLSRDAMRALGRLGTAEAQRGLVEYAAQVTQPLEDRQAAANAFRYATVVRGLQLSPSQIQEQYERRRMQAEWDASTRAVMDQVVQTLERYRHGTR